MTQDYYFQDLYLTLELYWLHHSLWSWQWKMSFNVDKTKEVIFSSKRSKPQHPLLNLGSDVIARKTEHKHLGMNLDENLDLKSHIQ